MLREEPELQEALRIIPLEKQRIDAAISNKELSIRNAASSAQKRLEMNDVKLILNQSGFLKHLNTINEKATELETRAEQNEAYKPAAQAARMLYNSLEKARDTLLVAPGNTKDKIDSFKTTSADAIKLALPVLEQHRGWKQFFADIASAILTVATVFGTYLVTNRFRLFSPSTDSGRKLLDLEQNIQGISVSSGG